MAKFTPIGTRDIAGNSCLVYARADGAWQICLRVDDDNEETVGHSSDSLDSAVQQARTHFAKKKVRVEVPFRLLSGTRAVATGIHAGTQKVTVRVERNFGRATSDQLDPSATVLKPETPDERIEQMKHLKAESSRLSGEAREIEREYGERLGWMVREAIDAAASEAATHA